MCDLRSRDRKQFFAILKAKYMTYYKQIKGHAPAFAAADMAHNLSLSEQATKSMPGQEVMINAYWEMVNLLDKLFGSGKRHKPKFVIALDEAHSLNGPSEFEVYHLLTVLCRAISVYSRADRAANHAI